MERLRFQHTSSDPWFDLLLGVCADLTVRVNGRPLYYEPDFPVVELARALQSWASQSLPALEDFEFESLDSEAIGLLWFRFVDGGYRAGSIYQEFPAMATYSAEELRSTIDQFVRELRSRSADELGIDIELVLSPR